MGRLSITGVGPTLANLKRIGRSTSKAALREVRKGGEKIKERARKYAPIDEGDLESAIITAEQRFGNERITVFVGVDPGRLGRGYSQYRFRYDIEMHEGNYDLGPKSSAKNIAQGGGVGPKYLERAYKELEDEINDAVRSTVKRHLT